MIRSMLKQLQLGETDQALLSFIDEAMKVEERKKLLENHYSQELSLLYILQEDYERAKYYTNYAMELFMEVCSYASLNSENHIDCSISDCALHVFDPVELLQCGYAVDSKSFDHPPVSAGPDGNPGFSAVH